MGIAMPDTISQATKEEKKAIKRFYKSSQYSASYVGHDSVYLIKADCTKIIGSVIISQVEDSHWLHGLVIAPEHRDRQLANRLLQQVCPQHLPLFCFVSAPLKRLYLHNGFSQTDSSGLPDALALRYQAYLKNDKTLLCFRYGMDNDRC